ncbi:MAG TPA: hypothetical protein VIX59_08285 [Candidatus Binataceae bacterium]
MILVIDPDGTLIDPEFHDGLLLGIVLSPDGGDLTLLCRRVDGRDFSLALPRLVRLRADNFLEGNIIFGISIYEGDSCPPEDVRWVWDYNDEHAQQYLPKHMKDITDERWTLLKVTTSYGCELVALSKAHADEITVT